MCALVRTKTDDNLKGKKTFTEIQQLGYCFSLRRQRDNEDPISNGIKG